MKVVTGSDLHLEHYMLTADFGLVEYQIKNHYGADVLILAGDVMDSSMIYTDRANDLFGKLNEAYPYILYVMGNHEHYHGDFAETSARLKRFLQSHYNVQVLDKEGTTINGKRFFGGTMWTDFNGEDVMAMSIAKTMMNDYQCIRNSNTKVSYKIISKDGQVTFYSREGTFAPDDATQDHRAFRRLLDEDMAKHPDMEYFVISHHSPSFAFCDVDKFGYDEPLNYAYHTKMDDFILDRPRIKKWTFGHTHGRKRLTMGDCEVILNARGYSSERMSITFDFAEVQF